MSEVFEALQKAQREADARQAADDPAQGENGAGAAPPIERVGAHTVSLQPVRRRRSRRSWFRFLRRSSSRNGHDPEATLLMSPGQETSTGEQFRMLRTRIEMAGPGTVMITSALDQEGKTLCATNLAVALSMRIGPDVVLVDADLRNPSVAPFFGLLGNRGLVDCLMGDARVEDCIVRTRHERLSVLPAGRRSELAPELLGSDRMGAVMSDLKARLPTSYIVVDAPPLLLTADPMVIARQMDHILLVVRANVTPRAAVMKAVETIGADRIFGVILNDVTDSISHYYYYGRYPAAAPTENAP